MSERLRVAVADDDPDVRDFYEKFIPLLGHELAAVAEDGARLVELCRGCRPNVIVADIKMPKLDGVAAVEAVRRELPAAAVLVSGHPDGVWLGRARAAGVEAFLVKPVTDRDLGPAIALAWQQFSKGEMLKREAAELRQALEDRKLVERAKGAVSRRLRVDEDEAYRRLRLLGSHTNRKMADVAREVIAAEDVFKALERFD